LPPLVDVVLIQLSAVKVFAPTSALLLTAKPLPVPSKVDALLASSMIAPAVPRVTPVPAAASLKPIQSTTALPEGSPRRQ
jgi:hypothetical protein